MGPSRTYTAIDGSNSTSPIKYASNDGLVRRGLANNETTWNFTVVSSLAEATQNSTYGNETTGNSAAGAPVPNSWVSASSLHVERIAVVVDRTDETDVLTILA